MALARAIPTAFTPRGLIPVSVLLRTHLFRSSSCHPPRLQHAALQSTQSSFATAAEQEGTASNESVKRRDDSVEGLLAGLVEGDRYALARAITLVESSNPKHRVQAQRLLSKILERESSLASEQRTSLASVTPSLDQTEAQQGSDTFSSSSGTKLKYQSHRQQYEQKQDQPIRLGKSFRIGLSGPPGVGKSTFIETFGMYLLSKGHRVSVLAVDPSSARTGGSILGDKTRMTELSRDTKAYVRPSPSRGTLGGVCIEGARVARNTTEAITLCEAAGYDICLVETVGVGQSETMVADIVDMFVLLVPPAGGDELQGMKKGIMELSDLVIVNKSDGALVDSARNAQIEYTSALKFVKAISSNWKAKVIRVSSMGGPEGGIEQAWNTMKEYFDIMESSGELQRKRGSQRKIWMWRQVSSELLDLLNEDEQVRELANTLEAKVLQNKMMSGAAAHQIVERFMKGMNMPYCCIYAYEAPSLESLDSECQELQDLIQNSRQGRLVVVVHYVKFRPEDLKSISSPERASVEFQFEQRTDVQRFLDRAKALEVFPKPRRILILVNPNGGVGRAKTISENIIKPMLMHSGLTFKVQHTEYARHAVDIAHNVPLEDVDTLVVVSGDGVLHEIINGLLSRPNWDQARRLPIAIIPAGSANAIATSTGIQRDCGIESEFGIGARNPIIATLAVIRGKTVKLDIFSLSQQDRPRIYSMLLFSWGMMADADIESDKYRWLGPLRFEIAGFIRMIRLRRYPGRVYVLPPRRKSQQASTISESENSLGSNGSRNGPAVGYPSLLRKTSDEPPAPWRLVPNMPFYSMLLLLNCPYAGETIYFTDTIRFNDGVMRLWYSCETRFWKILLPFVLDQANGKLVERGLMQDMECGGLLIIPSVEGQPRDRSTHEIVDQDLVMSTAAKRQCIYQKPGVFDVDGEVMPTARTLVEILPSFMEIVVPEWFQNGREEEGDETAESILKAQLVRSAYKGQTQATSSSKMQEAGVLILTVVALVTSCALFFREDFQMWMALHDVDNPKGWPRTV
ncbi:hypothetical protein EDD11_000634 [Mortierella claussenii]|nr:hypothetical protein EDD11_000634 [Mortierella claussenii]